MSPNELQAFLHQNIPASAALGIRVNESAPKQVILCAPIARNCNHHHTVFGGSIALLATLCGWSLVHLRYPESGGRIVIQESSIRYLKPAVADLSAVCTPDDAAAWAACTQALAQRGKGRITLACRLYSKGVLAAEFEGKYVVFAKET